METFIVHPTHHKGASSMTAEKIMICVGDAINFLELHRKSSKVPFPVPRQRIFFLEK